jgi:hypothetical protein
MLRTPCNQKLAFALTLICGLVPLEAGRLLGQAVNDSTRAGDITARVTSPAPHSTPILTRLQNPNLLWNQLSRQQPAYGEQLPNSSDARVNLRIPPAPGMPRQSMPIQSSSANAVTVPLSDETEKAIAEVRLRLGNAGTRFSDLLSPEDEARLFAEALSQVRQEQQPSAVPQLTQTPPVLQLPAAAPYQVPLDRPGPGVIPHPAVLPPLVARHPEGHPQFHRATGQPNPSQPLSPSDQLSRWSHLGPQPAGSLPIPPGVFQPETEQAALRRIARQIDALAEQLENIKHYSEADSLRRSAQQFRESVR